MMHCIHMVLLAETLRQLVQVQTQFHSPKFRTGARIWMSDVHFQCTDSSLSMHTHFKVSIIALRISILCSTPRRNVVRYFVTGRVGQQLPLHKIIPCGNVLVGCQLSIFSRNQRWNNSGWSWPKVDTPMFLQIFIHFFKEVFVSFGQLCCVSSTDIMSYCVVMKNYIWMTWNKVQNCRTLASVLKFWTNHSLLGRGHIKASRLHVQQTVTLKGEERKCDFLRVFCRISVESRVTPFACYPTTHTHAPVLFHQVLRRKSRFVGDFLPWVTETSKMDSML